MRCRHFMLRRSPGHVQEDADHLNAFLQQMTVYNVQTSSSDENFWSVLVFYEQPPDGCVPSDDRLPLASSRSLSDAEYRIYTRLQAWRARRANRTGQPAELLAHDEALAVVARHYMSLDVATALATPEEE